MRVSSPRGSGLWLLVQSRCLKSPASDLVIVPGAVAEDVAIKSDAELSVGRAGSNCNVVPYPSPFQNNTEPHCSQNPRRPVSLERYHLRPRVSVNLNCSSFNAVDEHIVARLLPTPMTVACNHRPERSRTGARFVHRLDFRGIPKGNHSPRY